MRLERRFEWTDRESVYKAIEESTVERATEGRVRFIATRVTDGNNFEGVSYPTTVAAMVDTPTGFWKLAANPKNTSKSIVVSVAAPPLRKSAKT